MWDTVAGVAHVLCLATGDVEVDPQQDVLLNKTSKVHTDLSRVIKYRMRWAGHVARMGQGKVHTAFWRGNLREGDHMKDPVVDGRIILK
jgi:hypothetical protein